MKKERHQQGRGRRKCVEHELTDRISFSRAKKEKKKIPDDAKLILVRFSVDSYWVQQHLSLGSLQEKAEHSTMPGGQCLCLLIQWVVGQQTPVKRKTFVYHKNHITAIIKLSSSISNTRDSVSSGYPNTEKRVEKTSHSGVFLKKFEVFG